MHMNYIQIRASSDDHDHEPEPESVRAWVCMDGWVVQNIQECIGDVV